LKEKKKAYASTEKQIQYYTLSGTGAASGTRFTVEINPESIQPWAMVAQSARCESPLSVTFHRSTLLQEEHGQCSKREKSTAAEWPIKCSFRFIKCSRGRNLPPQICSVKRKPPLVDVVEYNNSHQTNFLAGLNTAKLQRQQQTALQTQ
jgi:hypothetical protein